MNKNKFHHIPGMDIHSVALLLVQQKTVIYEELSFQEICSLFRENKEYQTSVSPIRVLF